MHSNSTTSSSRHRRHVLWSAPVLGLAAAAALSCVGTRAHAAIVQAGADAELRENQPEFTRGAVPQSGNTSTQRAELQISSAPAGTGNHNVGVMRFTIPASITSSADLQNFAALRLFFRSNGMPGGATGSLRLYGLNPTNVLNTSWNEDQVMYRDAGDHQLVTPIIGAQSLVTPSVLSQPSPGAITSDPVSPIVPTTPAPGNGKYNADPNHPRRAPGIRYEDAPYSQQVVDENNARYSYNQNQRAQFVANPNGTFSYLPYVNQPGYNVSKTQTSSLPSAITTGDHDPSTTGDGYTDIFSDVPESNRPMFSGPTDTYVDDLDTGPTGYNYIGFLSTTLPGSGNTNFEGHLVSFGDKEDLTTSSDPNTEANLLNFIGHWVDLGFHDLTFLIGPGIGDATLGDPVNNVNLQIASKDYTPTATAPFGAGVTGAYAPQLLLAPEPGAIALSMAAAMLTIGRRRRR